MAVQEKTLYRASANGTGTTLDTGANSLVNKLNVNFKFPATVTGVTITLNSGPDGSTWTAVETWNNVLEAIATIKLIATHRYYQVVVTNYAGSGLILVTCEPGEAKEIA